MLDVLYQGLASFGVNVGFCNFMQAGTGAHWIILKVG